MDPRTTARIAVVTGGAGGLGFACAERLAAEGMTVAILDLDGVAARSAAGRLPDGRGTHLGCGVDVTSPADVRRGIGLVRESLGAPDVLVNNAGILEPTPFLDIDLDEWHRVLAVSLDGTFLCTRECLPAMIASRFGRIVNFSSSAGKSVSTLGGAHYTAAKAGVLGLTRAVAKEVAPFGITVNAVCPGLFDTDMVRRLCSEIALDEVALSFPVGRLGRPDEVAELVAFLSRDDAAYITGAAIDINGGDLMV